MSFRLRLKYYLVHSLNYAGKKADEIIGSQTLKINGEVVKENVILHDLDEIELNGTILKEKARYEYYALHKPRGIESTFNKKIEHNLSTVFPFDGKFNIAGRLDKDSEGLLLISTNGKWVNGITRPDSKKEKEYLVEVNEKIDHDFILKMGAGVDIGFYITQPCFVEQINENCFRIILTEGKNKQIRRMCKKLGKTVSALKRIRIDEIYLGDLQVVESRKLDL
jgi:23S rRNA pseudouridine2604 synthase